MSEKIHKAADYICKKMPVALGCLCGEGTFNDRLVSSGISALGSIKETDLGGSLGDDLKFILSLTKENMLGGKIKRELDEEERRQLIEKMVHVLIEATRAEDLERSLELIDRLANAGELRPDNLKKIKESFSQQFG